MVLNDDSISFLPICLSVCLSVCLNFLHFIVEFLFRVHVNYSFIVVLAVCPKLRTKRAYPTVLLFDVNMSLIQRMVPSQLALFRLIDYDVYVIGRILFSTSQMSTSPFLCSFASHKIKKPLYSMLISIYVHCSSLLVVTFDNFVLHKSHKFTARHFGLAYVSTRTQIVFYIPALSSNDLKSMILCSSLLSFQSLSFFSINCRDDLLRRTHPDGLVSFQFQFQLQYLKFKMPISVWNSRYRSLFWPIGFASISCLTIGSEGE